MTRIEAERRADTIVSRRGRDSTGQARRIMTGDRFCTKCGYNLVGQEIVREEHYEMLIVRCPECATVTGLEDYPRLGVWAARWGIVLAGLWMILLLGLWPATSGIMLGFSMVMVEEGSRDYGHYLDDLQTAAEARSVTPAPSSQSPAASDSPTAVPPIPPLPGPGSPGTITIQGTTFTIGGRGNQKFQDWWAQQDQPAVLATAGGWWGVFDWIAFLFLIPAGAILLVLGCFWSVFLLQVPRRRLVYCGAAIVGLACVLAMIPLLDLDARAAFSSRRAAQYQLALPSMAISIAVLCVPLSLGLAFGRSLARLSVTALLPPRLRGPLLSLWPTDK
jgi:hypothetical protein